MSKMDGFHWKEKRRSGEAGTQSPTTENTTGQAAEIPFPTKNPGGSHTGTFGFPLHQRYSVARNILIPPETKVIEHERFFSGGKVSLHRPFPAVVDRTTQGKSRLSSGQRRTRSRAFVVPPHLHP